MFYYSIAAVLLSITAQLYTMDTDKRSLTEVPSEVINQYIIPKLEFDEQQALVCTCKHFNNEIIRDPRDIILAPKQYNYLTKLMQQKRINIDYLRLLQLPGYDLDVLFKAANTFGIQEVIIECCSGQYDDGRTPYVFYSLHDCSYENKCQPLCISPLLNDNKQIQSLTFAGERLKINVGDLCSTLQKNSSLTELLLQNTKLPDKDIGNILRAANTATNLKRLDLYGNPMSTSQLGALRTNTSLTNLGLRGCQITTRAAAQSIVEFINNNTQVQNIDLRGHDITYEVNGIIHPALVRLELRKNTSYAGCDCTGCYKKD